MISSKATIGKSKIYDKNLVNIKECTIGDKCEIHPFVTILSGVKIGNLCKIGSYVFIPSGVTIDDEVFLSQGVCFTNDKYPRATISGKLKSDSDYQQLKTFIKKGVSIGSNSTILCGITIGEGAMIGAGSVVTKDVPPHALVLGNPARVVKTLKE